jgi:predicted house-cleaning noncanonical NTP pyrophosphatase (MazG superfamily)
MTSFNKLVRDHIPAIIEASGRTAITETLHGMELTDALAEKLNEEVAEFQESRSTDELADILEVVHALGEHLGVNIDELEAIRENKAVERGGFSDGVFLVETREP